MFPTSTIKAKATLINTKPGVYKGVILPLEFTKIGEHGFARLWCEGSNGEGRSSHILNFNNATPEKERGSIGTLVALANQMRVSAGQQPDYDNEQGIEYFKDTVEAFIANKTQVKYEVYETAFVDANGNAKKSTKIRFVK